MPAFYDTDILQQAAINLFYGMGYNFYRLENQLRADDQLVRSRCSELLAGARAAVTAAEDTWRREHLPPPTRAQPYPDAAAVAASATLERLARDIAGLGSRMLSLPVPANDRMTQRFRGEAPTLAALVDCDRTMIGQISLLRDMIGAADAAALLAAQASLAEGIAAITATLQSRAAILMA